MSSKRQWFIAGIGAIVAVTLLPVGAAAQAGAPMAADVVGGYASDHILVKFKPGVFARTKARAAARAIGDRAPTLSARLNGALTTWQAQGVRPAYAGAFSSPEMASAIGLDRTYVIEVPKGTDAPAMVAALGGFGDEIELAELDGIGGAAEFIPDDTDFDVQWGLHNLGDFPPQDHGTIDADIDAPEAWDMHTGDLGTVTVAIIDSGVDPHLEFADRLLPGTNTADPANPDPTADDCGHGTHVAGIVAARGNNATGVAGVTWGANILPVRVLSTSQPCWGYESWAAEGVIWAVDHGADICNMSLQYYTGSLALQEAVDYAYANGVLVVAAAGNTNVGPIAHDVISFPARFEHAMAVSMTDHDDLLSGLSRYGNELDVAAPGDTIYSTLGTDSYGYLTGTSMAAPHVSGTAALMLSYVPGLPHVAMRNILKTTADDLGDPGWDEFFGYGRINAAAALILADKTAWITSSDPPSGAIDARQPHELDGSSPAGWQSVDITFSGATSELTADDFSVTVDGSAEPAPRVLDVLATADPNTVTVVLASAIPVGAWTTIRHDFTGTEVRLGYLPGDVDGNGTSDQSDIIAVIDAINGVIPRDPWQSDVDRNGVTEPPDIIRVVDLLNGAGAFDPYLGVSLP